MLSRSQRTLTIEAMLKEGQSVSSIAREFGVTRQRVQSIKARLLQGGYEAVTGTPAGSASPLKVFTISLTLPVHDAVVEACAVTNRKSPEEPITITEYVEECVITRVVELGLLRRKKR